MLDAAYDDALGVTAAFNRNALLHLNQRFGFDFALEAFVHRGFYNEREGRIEMHLEAARDQVVHLGTTRAALRRGRAHPHRELVQVPRGGVRGAAQRGGLRHRAPLGKRGRRLLRLLRVLAGAHPVPSAT